MTNVASLRAIAPDPQLGEAEPPRASSGSGKKTTAVPLTISLPRTTITRSRILSSAKGISLSRLVAALLEDAIKRELPGLLADLTTDQVAP